MVDIRFLIERLEDPFEMFPMQSVSRYLARTVIDVEERRVERSDPWGASSPYPTVEDEHDIEVAQLLIGSVFVLGQAAITQAVSLVKRMYQLAGSSSGIPTGKEDIMALESPIHVDSGLKKISLINAVANYFKHRHEWWDDWSGPEASLPTIRAVSRIGLSPSDQYNLETALLAFDIAPDNMVPLSQLVSEWREKLAANLRARLDAREQ